SQTAEPTSIKVFCRLRQQNQLEKREGATECSTVVDQRTIILRNERCDVDEIRCTFDRVFDTSATQEEVYEYTAKPLVSDFLQGYNWSKSSTLAAGRGAAASVSSGETVELTVSFVEIYMEQIRDLLITGNGGASASTSSASSSATAAGAGGLKIRENAQKGIYIEDMTQVQAATENATMELVNAGILNRAVSSTRMNKDSSRSHSILIIACTRRSPKYTVKHESAPGIGPGGVFKELYQQAIDELEEKNKKIDELQRLLSAVVCQEAEQLAESDSVSDDQQRNESCTLSDEQFEECRGRDEADTNTEAATDDGCVELNSSGSEEDEDYEEEDGQSDHALEVLAREKEELARKNTTLGEENKRLLHVLEALESQLDQVVVQFSSGKPVLSLKAAANGVTPSATASPPSAATPAIKEPEQHLLSLKIWLQSDKWQQSLEPESTEPAEEARDLLDNADGSELQRSASHLLPCTASTDRTPCVHRLDAEALSRQIVELKLQLHYVSENTKLALDGESYGIVLENAKLKTRIEGLEFQANLGTVTCSQLETKNRACETRLSNQETHIGCLQNSLQEYQGLFKQQIIMSQEKCRLLTDELEFYKKLTKCSQPLVSGLHLTTSVAVSPPKASPSPRKQRATASSNTLFSTAPKVAAALFPELSSQQERCSSPVTSLDSDGGTSNPFGLWRGFGSFYKPTASSTTTAISDSGGNVEIELAEKTSVTLPQSTPAPILALSAKMSRPIVKPIGAPSPATASLNASRTTSEQQHRQGDVSVAGGGFAPWIVKGFGGASSGVAVANTSSARSRLRTDATLDELAAPIEMH
ncbi:hypothetical protein PybrP1_004861, partial [[Pythium] brassicae (nom. inval.)]